MHAPQEQFYGTQSCSQTPSSRRKWWDWGWERDYTRYGTRTLTDVHHLETMPGEMAARIVALALLCFVTPNPGWTVFQAYSLQLLDY